MSAYPENPQKIKNGLRELGKVNLEPITNLLAEIPAERWEGEESDSPNPNKKGGILQKASHLTLKFTKKSTFPFEVSYADIWEKCEPVILPIMDELIKIYGYNEYHFPIIMFAKLPPGSPIIPHTDGNMSAYAPHKIHIPVYTNERSWFYINETRYHLDKGKAFEVDNIASHGAINAGNTDRVHLIFECMFGLENQYIRQE